LRSDASIPATPLPTTSASSLDSGYFQCAEFMTEWITSPVRAAASLISAASPASVTVCISMPAKPASTAIWKRSR
jgi:hypothetical protein